MADHSELWNKYAGDFNSKLEESFGGDWSKLDEAEQEIAALWKLTADVYMNGFDEFFINWGYECYCYAMRGIKRIAEGNSGNKKIGCFDVYKLFDTAYNKVFARFENDERIRSYDDIPQYFTEEDERILEKTFDEFDEKLGELLCVRAYEFYCEKMNKRV